jgi:hypothetical protein
MMLAKALPSITVDATIINLINHIDKINVK